MRVVDRAGRSLPDRIEGRIEFRGPSVTGGYFRRPEATRAVLHEGWITADRTIDEPDMQPSGDGFGQRQVALAGDQFRLHGSVSCSLQLEQEQPLKSLGAKRHRGILPEMGFGICGVLARTAVAGRAGL